ncbi:MAG: hypothetical protein LBC89_01285 [Bacteroidales bacterium]|jgi:hypothetical protein|nr:hypothetical protein [Bacteroidales bacterium]
MSNKLLITLIEKDIRELLILTKGFEQMGCYPQVLIDLSIEKTASIMECLKQLPLSLDEKFEDETATTQPAEPHFTAMPSTEQPVIEPAIEKSTIDIDMPHNKNSDYEQMYATEFEQNLEQDRNIFEQEDIKTPTAQITENNPIKLPVQEQSHPIIEPKDEVKEIAILNDTLQINENILFNSINKISDIKQAISISDRFRLQRELFEGNGEKLSQALSDFNQMHTLEQAKAYITNKLKWDLQKSEVADFIELLKRKLD